MKKLSGELKNRLRYNIVSVFVYIIGIVLLIQLFNLQIVHGEEYREQSNTRLTRETTVKAARGNILDSTGNKLVSNKMTFNVEIYKSKIDNNTLNNTILETLRVLETNGDSYVDNLPISINPIKFTYTQEADQIKWKKDLAMKEENTAEQCFYALKEKYGITSENIEDARKIMVVRYEINIKGYSNTKPIKIATNISRQSALQFNERNNQFPGISVITEPAVTYPGGTLAAHLLGTVGRITTEELKTRKDTYDQNDIIGKTGLEYVFEDYLKGTDGIKQVDMSVDGTITDEVISKEAIAGDDVVLTIDANLQKVLEESLQNNIQKIASGGFSERSDAQAGSAVVMNVNTGEVLAMASYPTYEPELFVDGISTEKWNEYNTNIYKPLINRAVASAYAPGSTFKMVVALAGLETGTINTSTKINDTGRYTYYKDFQPYCWNRSGHGWMNVTRAIEQSCNYFFYDTGRKTGIENIEKYAYALGLGHKTGIELSEEASGMIAGPNAAKQVGVTWNGGDVLSAAIGQAQNNYTPLQMVKYTSMLANGGKNIDVTLIKSIISADGNEVSKQEISDYVNKKLGLTGEEKVEDLNINPDNLKAILNGMKGVTSDNGGTAYSTFRGFNIEVGGKTGTATVNEKVANGWFVGFAPFDNPEIAVVVLVENGGHGGYTAEVARDIIAQYFGMNANKVTEDMNAIPTTQLIR